MPPPAREPNQTDQRIAALAASLVPTGATIQYGLGKLPEAVVRHVSTPVSIVSGLVTDAVVELEEQHLRKLFADYADYAKRVPKLIPRITAAKAGKHFEWRLYRRNREYEALAGFLAGAAVLIWKTL